MGRDHRKLVVFAIADQLVMDVYQISEQFPPAERFGMQIQLRKAAVSVVTNIVEGSARKSIREYLSFLNIATGSAAEAAYLAELAGRLGCINPVESQKIGERYGHLVAQLNALMRALSRES